MKIYPFDPIFFQSMTGIITGDTFQLEVNPKHTLEAYLLIKISLNNKEVTNYTIL